jgi:hypothetical protein
VKRDELVRQLLAAGCVLLRHGGRHDIFLNPQTGQGNHYRGIAKSKISSQNIS